MRIVGYCGGGGGGGGMMGEYLLPYLVVGVTCQIMWKITRTLEITLDII